MRSTFGAWGAVVLAAAACGSSGSHASGTSTSASSGASGTGATSASASGTSSGAGGGSSSVSSSSSSGPSTASAASSSGSASVSTSSTSSAAASSSGVASSSTNASSSSTTASSSSSSTASSSSASSSSSSTASSASSSSSSSGAGGGGTGATIRVHYPAGTHAVTLRGSSAGLTWTAGAATVVGGSDTYTYALPALGVTIEYKPLLDDTTWARGPNYHVSPGQTVDIWPHFTSTQGQFTTLIATFHSTVLSNDRAIYAYLPASYTENTDATYPVVYMHDGQNLWAADPGIAFAGTWNVDTAFDQATENGTCSAGGLIGWGAQPLGGTAVTCTGDGDCPSNECRTFPEAIIIGVANTTSRIYEYTPTTDPTTPGGGGADLYLQMLVTELKPAVDAMLRTRPGVASTAMCGSSLGGLMTAYAGLKRPDVYGLVAELSPSSWWNNDVIVADIMGTQPAPARPGIVYVDSGQGTADDEADTDMLAAAYLALGYVDGTNFRHVIQPGAAHSETYWAERFPGAMQLVLGVRW